MTRSPAPFSLHDDRRAMRRALLAFVAMLSVLAAITSWFLLASWDEQMRDQRAELADTAQIVQVAVQNHLDQYSAGLALLSRQLRATAALDGSPDALTRALRDFRASEPDVSRLYLLDGQGRVLACAGVPAAGVPTSATAPAATASAPAAAAAPQPPAQWLRVAEAARQHPGTLQLGHALRMTQQGPLQGQLQVPLAWAQAPGAGRDGFVLVGALDQTRENLLYRALQENGQSPRTMFGVMDRDGYLLGRWPLTRSLDADTLFAQPRHGLVWRAMQVEPSGNRRFAQGPADADPKGGDYIGALHNLAGYPLTAFVITPRSEVMLGWWRRVRLPLTATGGLAALLLLLLARELAQQRRWLAEARTLLESHEQAHRAQRKDAALFAQILDNLPGGLIVFNARGVVQYCNQGFARMTGLAASPRDLIGRSWRMVWSRIASLHAGGRDALRQAKILSRERQPSVDEVWLTDGRIFLRHYTPLFDAQRQSAGALWTIQDVTEPKLQEQQIRELAERDSLTGLSNRGAFEKLLAQALEHHDEVALGIADLDDFKLINDRFGHGAGDALLVEVAARLRGALRLSEQSRQGRGADILARIGGDEFALLLPMPRDPQRAQRVAERVMSALREPIEVEGQMLSARMSLGLALRTGGEDAQTLMRQADIALYAAKARGRNQACLFDQTMQAEVEARQGWLTALEQALEQDQLELYMQPILTVPRQRGGEPSVTQVEGLLRLRDTGGRLHNAGEFEHVLDEPRVAAPLGRWVLERAADWLTHWRAAGLDLGISVNISPRHFLGPRFLDDLRDLLGRHPRLRPSSITLELTEHGTLLDGEATRRRIEECHVLGVQVSLDDFGTGSASLTHLQALAASTLKIERRFVKDLLHDARDLSIAYGILRTAQLMGVRVVAEGVETPDLARVLVAMGCKHLQGYAIARPMPATQLVEWMSDWRQRLGWSADLGKGNALGPDGIEAIVSLGTMLRQLLQGALDEETEQLLRQPDAYLRCPLGQWCRNHGGRWRHQAPFEELVQMQADLYALVRRWLDEPLARPALELEMHLASDELRERFWALTVQGTPAALFVLQPGAVE